MVIVILLFSIFVMEILLEEISYYTRSSRSLQKRRAELDLTRIQKKFQETKGRLAILNNPITCELYKQQIQDIEKLEAHCKTEINTV